MSTCYWLLNHSYRTNEMQSYKRYWINTQRAVSLRGCNFICFTESAFYKMFFTVVNLNVYLIWKCYYYFTSAIGQLLEYFKKAY